jgi:uncharacterized alpha-E superfamily protein
MLSRVADAIYWMSRYLERAENIARFIQVNWHISLEDHSTHEDQQWEPLLEITGDNELFAARYRESDPKSVIQFLTLDNDYPHSIISCLRAARENARTVREIISGTLWEQINMFYHMVHDLAHNKTVLYENPFQFCREVELRGMMLGGIASDTITHGEGWHFFQMGRLLERADKTSRILDVKYFILLPNVHYVGTIYDDIQWTALLQATNGLNAYRQQFGRISPGHVVEFLLLNRQFPRSTLYCLLNAQQSLHQIHGSPMGTYQNKAEKLLGQLCAELAYISVEQILTKGLHEFTDQLQVEMNRVDIAIGQLFFGVPIDELTEP